MSDDRRTVLVVEDDAPLRRMLSMFLRAAGYHVRPAEDGPSGLALARDERPDLVLLDLMLPGLDGWEGLRRIKGDARTVAIPVVMLTASVAPRLTSKPCGSAPRASSPSPLTRACWSSISTQCWARPRAGRSGHEHPEAARAGRRQRAASYK